MDQDDIALTLLIVGLILLVAGIGWAFWPGGILIGLGLVCLIIVAFHFAFGRD